MKPYRIISCSVVISIAILDANLAKIVSPGLPNPFFLVIL